MGGGTATMRRGGSRTWSQNEINHAVSRSRNPSTCSFRADCQQRSGSNLSRRIEAGMFFRISRWRPDASIKHCTLGPVGLVSWYRRYASRKNSGKPIGAKIFIINGMDRQSAKQTQSHYHQSYQSLSVILRPFLKKDVWLGRDVRLTIPDRKEGRPEFEAQRS
jgi:hypothetical protein